jgi:zinc/manganese transport system substrate-binding protein
MIATVKTIFITFLIFVMAGTSTAKTAIRIVAALPDLGSIAAFLAAGKGEVISIAKANANPHSVEVFPSSMAKVSRAAIYLKSGLGLDQWSDAIVEGSRNNKIRVVDCSIGIVVLEKPAKVDASMGDVHPFGNPHYWLDPRNGIVIGKNIVEALEAIDPANASQYESNFIRFKAECDSAFPVWQLKLKPIEGRKIITYHSSWAYFADAFHLPIIERIEPFPGIPPTGNHLAHLCEVIQKENVALILQEPYFPDDAPKFLNRQTGIKIFKCAPACPDVEPGSYLSHFDDIVNQLSTIQGVK